VIVRAISDFGDNRQSRPVSIILIKVSLPRLTRTFLIIKADYG